VRDRDAQPRVAQYRAAEVGDLAGKYLLFPGAVHLVVQQYGGQPLPMLAQIALTLLVVIPLGPMLYRLAYQPWRRRARWCC
jgi:hypothetical protein